MLSSTALDAAIEALPVEGALLSLQLSPAVAALQCAISTSVLREGHVAVQSIYRMCLQLFKAERSVPPETIDALRSLNESMLVNHGRSCLYMLRGNGGGQDGVHASARELADELRRRSNMLMGEVQIAEVYVEHLDSTWHALSFVYTCSDGMMLKRGLQLAEQSMSAYGLAEGPIDVQRARELLAMSDDDRRGVLRCQHH
ncbi:hypothetical protein M885DRAFT_621256 [Pelagophyceae sp. CCMP2097]|nr:hypothetical protein M885DRAFT_621256 [Pelagophyceae sp. CCMP2097]